MRSAGKTIHRQHHETPYFHVSLDPPGLILSVMAAAALLFGLLFQWGPLSLTATAAYYSAGAQQRKSQRALAAAAKCDGQQCVVNVGCVWQLQRWRPARTVCSLHLNVVCMDLACLLPSQGLVLAAAADLTP